MSPAGWDAAGGENMSNSAGECARFRRYPELPVWVVEDHQEVSRLLLGAGADRARAKEAVAEPRPRRPEREPEFDTRSSCIAMGKNTLFCKVTRKNKR